jgi:hypothetical protein
VTTPDLSIVLVNWNSLPLTSAALASIERETRGVDYEVFVVDNGTTRDDSVRELPRRFSWIRFIANSDNRGFSVANNQGIRESRGRYVLVLNNDTVQVENALGKCVQYMDAHPDIGVVGILHRNADAECTVQPSFFAYPRPWREVLGLLNLRAGPPAPPVSGIPPEADVNWLCGSFLFIRRECLEQVSAFDERFFIYDEDIDWCLRAWRAGWRVRFWPGASMIHIGAAARPFMRDKTFIHFRSHLSYIKKNHSTFAAVAYYIAMVLRLTLTTGRQTLRWLLGRSAADEVVIRYRRQLEFLLLKPGRAGALAWPRRREPVVTP